MAGVGGLVEAREVAFATGHDDGSVCVEGLDAAEVEGLSAGRRGARLPVVTIVSSVQNGAIGATGPGDTIADGLNATQFGGGVRVLYEPLCTAAARKGEYERNNLQ